MSVDTCAEQGSFPGSDPTFQVVSADRALSLCVPLEWLHASAYCCQEEPDADCIYTPELWSRDQHRHQAGRHPTALGLTGGPHGYGHLAAG